MSLKNTILDNQLSIFASFEHLFNKPRISVKIEVEGLALC